ncbi:acetoacetate--CoA ligase [Chloroflexota bacterium]
MKNIVEGTTLWEPSPEIKRLSNLTRYMQWLETNRSLSLHTYDELWRWSVTNVEEFWQSAWDYFQIETSKDYTSVLVERKMPGAEWFTGAELNYAQHVFRNITTDRPAILYKSEDEPIVEISWQELYDKTKTLAHKLKELGVQRGDRVVAYMPNIPETIVAFLACASLGAVWSSCSPDFGSPSVLDRFAQIEPKILIAVDGYRWNGKIYDRREVVSELQESLTSIEKTILVTLISDGSHGEKLCNTILWNQVIDSDQTERTLQYAQVPFNHPLWVLYSSGTTGLPKPIVQGQGGILLEHLKALAWQLDLTPQDKFFWYTSTGWMMWNFLVGGLLLGTTIILYNGSPSYPDMDVLWRLAQAAGMTYFGSSAAYISACKKAGLEPKKDFDLTHIRAVGSTGSPLSINGFYWIYQNVSQDIALESVSGGTDLCTPFVGGCRLLPVYAGEIQCRYLGAKVEAFDQNGESILDQVGELVISEPMPSMPLFFWDDPGNRRYLSSYFEMFPGIWRHGDWIKINQRGGCVIYGRSDATINRYGVRMGTSEIYQVVENLSEISDSLVVDLEGLGQASYMPLFVVLREGATLDEQLKARIKNKIRQDISPRHVPDDIFVIDQVPRTLSGKKIELPIRKILMGYPSEEAANMDAMRNPESIQYFVQFSRRIGDKS